MNAVALNIRQEPRGVFPILFTQMWESFSFFGMRALLVLFLVQELCYDIGSACLLYTLYISFVKIFGILGGYATDRYLGKKRAVIVGGMLIMTGHIVLTFFYTSIFLFLALSFIICGSALFRVSLQALLGGLYEIGDPRRDRGFTLFYAGMNLGGLAAATLCGIVAHQYGWHAGLGLATIGMGVGLLFFFSKMNLFEDSDQKQKTLIPMGFGCLVVALIAFFLYVFEKVHAIALPIGFILLLVSLYQITEKMRKEQIMTLVGALSLVILYFTAEELWGSLLIVFSEKHVHRFIGGVEIPSAVLAAMNPLTIILAAPIVAKLKVSRIVKCSLAFLCLSVGFCVLYVASLQFQPSPFYLLGGLGAIAMGELFLAPTIYSFMSESVPKEGLGRMMGTTTLAFSVATLLSGKVVALPFEPETIFISIAGSALVLFLLIFVLGYINKRRVAIFSI